MLKTVSASVNARVDGMTPRPYSTTHVLGHHSTAVAAPGPCTTVSPGYKTSLLVVPSLDYWKVPEMMVSEISGQ